MQNRILLLLILISLILSSSMLRRGHQWGDDFASYIMQAESILNHTTNEFIQHNSLTIFESSTQFGPVAYPWGFPLILTPVFALKGINPLALKLPGLFFYAGFLVCLYLLIKTRLTQMESLLIVLLFAFNPLLLSFMDQILSDVPFLFFSTLALLLMLRNEEHSVFECVALGLSIACAFFIRVTGILLLASFCAYELMIAWTLRQEVKQFKKHLANVFIVTATFCMLWLFYTLSFPGGGESYFAQYREFRIGTAINFIFSYIDVFRLFFGWTIIWEVLYYVLFVLFLFGAWKRRREDLLFILFFVFWMALLISWPFWQGARFIFPLLPIFVYFTFQGMHFVLEKLPTKYFQMGQWMAHGFWVLIAVIFLVNSSSIALINLQNNRDISGPFDPYSQEVYKYIIEKTPADSVVVFFKPRVMRLMTDRDSIMSTECDRILKGNYLVLSKKVGAYQQIPPEQIDTCSLPLKTVLSNRRFVVYRIQK